MVVPGVAAVVSWCEPKVAIWREPKVAIWRSLLQRCGALTILLCGCAGFPVDDGAGLSEQVAAAERAFAGTMAERDHDAFTSFLADEAIFFSGETPVRGKAAVAALWKPFFEGDAPPFSWEPDRVEVLDSGTLALSTGPVLDPGGHVIGRFNSIWRRERDGQWRVVFDKGSPVCPDVPGPGAAADKRSNGS